MRILSCCLFGGLAALAAPAQQSLPPAVQSVRVQLRDAKGGPIQDATVWVVGVQKGVIPYRKLPGQEPFALQPKDFAGDFARVADLPVGELALVVDHPLFARTVSKPFQLPSQREQDVVVVLSRGGVVEGRVLGPDQRPVANATVRTEGNELPAGPARLFAALMYADTLGSRSATTAADGTFRLERLAHGKHLLVVDHFVLAQTEVAFEVDSDSVRKLPPIAMVEGVLVNGRVVREGKPVAGADVTFWFEDVPATDAAKALAVKTLKTKSDAQGNFRLPARVAPGKGYVLAAAEGGAPLAQAAQLAATRRRFEVRGGAREQDELITLPK